MSCKVRKKIKNLKLIQRIDAIDVDSDPRKVLEVVECELEKMPGGV